MSNSSQLNLAHESEQKLNSKKEILTPSTTLKVPVELLGYRASPQILGRFGLDTIRVIAEKKSPYISSLLKDISHDDEIENLLCKNGETVEEQVDFWEAIVVGLFFLDRTRVEWLTRAGLEFHKNESKAAFVARAILEHNDVVNGALNRWYEDSGEEVGGRSYAIFNSTKSASETDILLKNIKLSDLSPLLKKHFEKRGYSSYCEIRVVDETKGKRGFILDHCSHQDTKAVMDAANKRKIRFDRDLLRDFVFFHEDSNALWVFAKSPSDIRVYADIVASLTGVQSLFREQLTFDLSKLIGVDVAEAMKHASERVGKRTTLKSFKVKKQDTNTTSSTSVDRYERCLSERMAIAIQVAPSEIIQAAKFGIELDPGKRKQGTIEFTSGKVKLGSGVTVDQALTLISILEMAKPYTNA